MTKVLFVVGPFTTLRMITTLRTPKAKDPYFTSLAVTNVPSVREWPGLLPLKEPGSFFAAKQRKGVFPEKTSGSIKKNGS